MNREQAGPKSDTTFPTKYRNTAPGNCAAPLDVHLDQPKRAEIPAALCLSFELSEALSETIARLDNKIRPVSRPSPPAVALKAVEAETEIGSVLGQLNGRFELMIAALDSMICRLEI